MARLSMIEDRQCSSMTILRLSSQPQRSNLTKWEAANIPEVGVIRDVLGPNDDQDMASNPGGHSVTQQVDRLAVRLSRHRPGDRHRGPHQTLHRAGKHRSTKETGTAIVNRRQIFAVSSYECHLLTRSLGVRITPELLGAKRRHRSGRRRRLLHLRRASQHLPCRRPAGRRGTASHPHRDADPSTCSRRAAAVPGVPSPRNTEIHR